MHKNRDDAVAAAMLSQFDPIVVLKFQGYRDRTQDIAMRMLNRWGANSTSISSDLMNIEMWKSQGQKIGYEDAQEIGLNITYLSPDDPRRGQVPSVEGCRRIPVRGTPEGIAFGAKRGRPFNAI